MMCEVTFRFRAAIGLAVILAGTPAIAQETGTVSGTVTLRENSGLVDGAVILVVGTGAFALTDDGRCEFTNVPVGTYMVTAERERLSAGRQMVTVSAGVTATADFELSLSPVREEVTVTAPAVGAEATLQAFNTVTTFDSFEIAQQSAGSLGEALEHEPGIANRSFGPGASRPIIRGFGGDRVLIIEDGIRTGDLSGTSDHHGMTIDPKSAERIEIVRGPATLLYGSSVAGLINVITPHAAYRNLLTPPQDYGETLRDGTRGQIGADTGSANARLVRTPACSIRAESSSTGPRAAGGSRATTTRRKDRSLIRRRSSGAHAPDSVSSATHCSRAPRSQWRTAATVFRSRTASTRTAGPRRRLTITKTTTTTNTNTRGTSR